MIWIGLVLIIIGVIIQGFTDEKKLGKSLWISGSIIVGIYLIIVIIAAIWAFSLISVACVL